MFSRHKGAICLSSLRKNARFLDGKSQLYRMIGSSCITLSVLRFYTESPGRI